MTTVRRFPDKSAWREWVWSLMASTRSPSCDYLYLTEMVLEPDIDRAVACSHGFTSDQLVAVNDSEAHRPPGVPFRCGDLATVVREWDGRPIGGVNGDFCGGMNSGISTMFPLLESGIPGRGTWWVFNILRGREEGMGKMSKVVGVTHRGVQAVQILGTRALGTMMMSYVPQAHLDDYARRLRPRYAEYKSSGSEAKMDTVAFRMTLK